MSADPEEAAAAESAPPAQLRERLRGWLLAAGMGDASAADALAATLLSGRGGEGAGVAGCIERLGGWLRAQEAAGAADPGEALRRLAEEGDPLATLDAVPAPAEAPGPRVPYLPPTLPREMKRQPLGRLPAVLRGGARILSTRWSLPNRIGPRISRSLWSWRSPGAGGPDTPAVEEPAPGA